MPDFPASAPLLSVQDLHFAYPGQPPLFASWSADFAPGVHLLQGEESVGKSTLLRLLAGELRVPQGRLCLQGQHLDEDPAAYLAQVFWVDPRADRPAEGSVTDWWATQAARWPRWNAQALAAHAVGFGLEEHAHKPFVALSTGTHRKVLMAAALASVAALALIDEPLAGLDRASERYLQTALAGVADAPDRVVVVAHWEALPEVPWRQQLVLGCVLHPDNPGL